MFFALRFDFRNVVDLVGRVGRIVFGHHAGSFGRRPVVRKPQASACCELMRPLRERASQRVTTSSLG